MTTMTNYKFVWITITIVKIVKFRINNLRADLAKNGEILEFLVFVGV